jgi:hypothetical protein
LVWGLVLSCYNKVVLCDKHFCAQTEDFQKTQTYCQAIEKTDRSGSIYIYGVFLFARLYDQKDEPHKLSIKILFIGFANGQLKFMVVIDFHRKYTQIHRGGFGSCLRHFNMKLLV